MISNTFQTNTFIEGMDCDTDIMMLSDKRYRYAENIRVITNDEGTTGVLQGIEGVKKYQASIPSNETIIGTTTIANYGVVVTVDTDGCNRIHRITNFDSASPTSTMVLKGYLGLCQNLDETPNISIVGNYESDDVIKIYFTDGKSSVKMFNIMETKYYDQGSGLIDSTGNVINTLAFDITPGCVLPPLDLANMGIGNLPSGVVQYCYQLFNLQGTQTTTSPLSEIIHLTASSTNQDSQEYEGSPIETSSNKSITLDAPLYTKDFERCRIIRILYYSNNQIPLFTIVDEIEVLPTQDTITYTDTGNSYIADISVDEFNALTGYQFIGSTLTKMQNRLFVADITDNTWNPGDYDARAYRCNASGQVVLQSANSSSTLSFNINSYDLSSVPKEHDCINPYNNMEYTECSSSDMYIYGISNGSNRLMGGHGVNIDYSFILTDIIVAEDSVANSLLSNDCSMNVQPTLMRNISRQEVGTNLNEYILLNDSEVASRIPNYADPYIASHFKGYQRDEIYRFGIIFYNNKSLPSPVYWIGDIKMPHNSQVPAFELKGNDLHGKALGIRFVVRNIPSEAVAYEIVRCDRTENDRHVVMQAVASNLYEYKILENKDAVGEGQTISSSVEMRPTPFFTNYIGDFSTSYVLSYEGSYMDYENRVTRKIYQGDRVTNYVKLVSPEICLQKNDIEPYLKDAAYLDFVGSYMSPTQSSNDYSVMSTASKTENNEGEMITWNNKAFVSRNGDGQLDIGFPNIEGIEGAETYGFSGFVSKYYYPVSSNTSAGSTVNIQDAVYALDIPYNAAGDVSAYRTSVGERVYTNYAMSNFREVGAQNLMGPSGPGLIVQANNYHSTFGGFNSGGSLNNAYSINAIPVINVKRNITSAYGGNTYTSRQNSVYISTNSYKRVSGSGTYETDTYGGDIYLGVLDYPNMFIFQLNDGDKWNWCKGFLASYIPFESSVNMNLLHGDMVHQTYSSSNFIDVHLQLEPQQTQMYHVQDEPYFAYNTVYSSQQGSKQYVPKSIYAEDYTHTNNRILVSQAKTSNEILDNWTQFRVADYLDVDNQYGPVTNLYTFKDKLFYFQNTAVGIASVNERSLITDENSNQLVLGTGGILTRFDYITTINGSSILNDRSITDSDNVMYWYDYDKNEICAYDGSVISLSKSKQVQSYLNELYTSKRNVNLAFYDKKYNEVWFKFYDKSLIFNEQLGRFTSYYTFNPDWCLPFSDKKVTIKDNIFYVINTLDTDGLGDIDKNATVEIVVNKDLLYTKTFDNIAIAGSLKDANGANATTGLINKIVFSDKHQTATANNPTFDYRENTYRLPIPRQDDSEENVSMSFPARMRAKCMTCDYYFNTNNENTFKIPFIITTYRYSLI